MVHVTVSTFIINRDDHGRCSFGLGIRTLAWLPIYTDKPQWTRLVCPLLLARRLPLSPRMQSRRRRRQHQLQQEEAQPAEDLAGQ